jgi:hypothetical protein
MNALSSQKKSSDTLDHRSAPESLHDIQNLDISKGIGSIS